MVNYFANPPSINNLKRCNHNGTCIEKYFNIHIDNTIQIRKKSQRQQNVNQNVNMRLTCSYFNIRFIPENNPTYNNNIEINFCIHP